MCERYQQKILDYNITITTMDKEYQQLAPQDLLKHAKKHPHSITISTEAFSVSGHDYVVHNISMKSDPANAFDIANYRRGLTFVEDIVDFREEGLRVAKKGLRKFYDLMPEFLGEKVSHLSHSKYYGSIRSKIIQPLKNEADQYTIYSTEKANGQNAQISWDPSGKFWIIGSKNKTLLLAELKDTKYINHKFQHVRTISIAELWFAYLEANPDKVEKIKEKLTDFVLVGEICDSVKSGHIVDYGAYVKLYFYALVGKAEREHSCEPPSNFLQFVKEVNLQKYAVKFNVTKVKSFEALMQELKAEMYRIYEGQLDKYGEGTVVYVTATRQGHETCQSISKIKTLEYRIYRKLRQKLKAYFQKFRKGYDKMLHKYIQQVKQLTKGFQTPKPQQYYFNIAKKAFDFCQDQQKAITKFFHNKFISFLKLLQNEKIDKEAFKKIVHQDVGNVQISKMLDEAKEEEKGKEGGKEKMEQRQTEKKAQQAQKKVNKEKKVAIFIPMTIPATGKSTLFRKISQSLPQYHIEILSSDTVRAARMQQLMKKQKNMSKKAAYEKTRDSANNQYYRELNDILKKMDADEKYEKFVLFMDKNHPENALKKTVQQISRASQKCKTLSIKIICILPECHKLLQQKPKYMYPFSISYIANCLKRVSSRQQHETLEGDVNHRMNISLCFANMFRNFAVSDYNLGKYFNYAITLPFTKQQQIPEQISQLIVKIMLGTKPGSFDEHPAVQELAHLIQEWKNQEIQYDMEGIRNKFIGIFEKFAELKVDVTQVGVVQVEKEEVVEKKEKAGKRKQKEQSQQVE